MSSKPFEHLPDGHPLKGKEVVVNSNEGSVVSLLGNIQNEMSDFLASSENLELQLDCISEALAYSAQMTYNLEQLQQKLLATQGQVKSD